MRPELERLLKDIGIAAMLILVVGMMNVVAYSIAATFWPLPCPQILHDMMPVLVIACISLSYLLLRNP